MYNAFSVCNKRQFFSHYLAYFSYGHRYTNLHNTQYFQSIVSKVLILLVWKQKYGVFFFMEHKVEIIRFLIFAKKKF